MQHFSKKATKTREFNKINSYICQQNVNTQTKTQTMKKFLMIAIALFTMASCAVVDRNMVATEYSKTSDSGNIADKLVSLINGYTDKINAVETVYDLFFISEKCYKDKMSFEKNYAEEITSFKNSLTEEAQTSFNEAIKTAMSKFEEAVNNKAKALADKQNTTK